MRGTPGGFLFFFAPPSVLGLLDFSLVPPPVSLRVCCGLPAQEIVRPPPLYAPAEVRGSVCAAAPCTKKSKATSALSAGRSQCPRVCGSLLHKKY